MVLQIVELQNKKRFLPKMQPTQRKFMNFENRCNAELSKIGHHFNNNVIKKMILSKNVNKKYAPKLVLAMKKRERFQCFLT